MTAERGTLFLVVGPSGAGKDTLIDEARSMLSRDPMFVFPRRDITRPAEAGGEDHRAVSQREFADNVEQGAYAFHWGAHGLYYGVPSSVFDDLAAGRSVIVNVSRGILDDARKRISPLRILSVSVDAGVLRQRLQKRGREAAVEIEARIGRADQYSVSGDDVITIDNTASVADGACAMVKAITGALADKAR